MKYIAPVGALALVACATPEAEAPAPQPTSPPPSYTCAAEPVQYAIGQKTSAELGSKLVAESGSRTIRWLPPRSAATMDYRQDRLNVAYDDNMVITTINCG